MEKEITGEMLLSRNIREIPTLLDPLLPKSGLVCLAGSSDTGKSAFLRQLSMSVSAGSKTFLGMRLNVVHHSAIYVSTEDDEIANAYLVARQNMDMKLSPQSLRGLRFVFDCENVVYGQHERGQSSTSVLDAVLPACQQTQVPGHFPASLWEADGNVHAIEA